MKELSIEEKAKLYDEAIKIAKSKIKNDNDHVLYESDIIEIFPEFKENEDERIKRAIIATIHLYYGEPLEDEAKEMIAWLEKQGEHKKFRDSIQVGDKVTRNEDGVLINLSQLNRVAKKDEKQSEQKPADEVGNYDHKEVLQTIINEHNSAWSEEDEKMERNT